METIQFQKPMTEKEAAEWLGVSIDTIRRIRKRGDIGFMKVGGRFKYAVRHLETYLKQNEVLPCDNLKSENTILVGGRTPTSGAQRGSIPARDRLAANRSALQMLKTPSSHWRDG